MFKDEESISKALKKNGQKLDNNIFGIQKQIKLFVGNLDFY